MTALADARESLYQAFLTGWASATPLYFENEDPGDQDAAWVRFSVRHTDAIQDTLGKTGNRRFIRNGSIFVQIFVPINQGLAQSDTYATAARNILEGKTIDSIHIYGVTTTEIGPDGEWYQVNVEAPFTYYIQK